MLDFEELRELAADVRVFVELAEDKAEALKAVIAAYDVVLAIFPTHEGMGLHVINFEHGAAALDAHVERSYPSLTDEYGWLPISDDEDFR